MIAYAPDNSKSVADAIEKCGGTAFESVITGIGVRIE
jgi:hypothetical protein